MPKDHVVPEFYLRLFGNDLGQVSIKTNAGLKKTNVRSALITEDFYSNPAEKANFESNLQITESRAAPIFKKLVVENQRNFSEKEEAELFEFICSTYLRSYRSRILTANMAEILIKTDFLEVENRISGSMSVKHREALDDKDIVIRNFEHVDPNNITNPQVKNMHFDSYRNVLSKAKERFQNYELHIIEFSRKKLITCDSPTVLFNDSGQTPSLYNAEQMYLPISPFLALLYIRRGSDSAHKVWAPSTVLQELLNNSIIRNARLGLISHPDDEFLISSCEIKPTVNELDVIGIVDQISGQSDFLTE